MSVHRATARGAVVTGFAQVFRLAFQLVTIVVMARLLGPAEYGVVAMAAVFVGLGEILREVGLSSATVQAEKVTDEEQTNLFWVNFCLGLVLAFALYFAAPWVADFNKDPRLTPVCRWLSVVFVLNGAAAQFRAQLNRSMMFGAISSADIASQVASAFCGGVLAYCGYGYWALVVQQLLQAFVLLALLALFSSWAPGRPQFQVSVRAYLAYGWGLMGAQVVNYAAKSVDSLLIGSRFGVDALGLYNRAYQLLMIPFSQLSGPSTSVALPLLSKIKDDGDFERALIDSQGIFIHLMTAIISVAVCFADPFLILLLGQKWVEVLPVFYILALGCVFQVASYSCYWVYLAKGLTSLHFRVTLAVRPLMVLLMVYGAQWGVNGVAKGYVVGLLFVWLGAIGALWREGLPARRMLTSALTVFGGYGLCVGGAIFAGVLCGDSYWMRPVLMLLSYAAIFALVLKVSDGFGRSLKMMGVYFLSFYKRRMG